MARQSPARRTSPVTQPCLPAGMRLSATAFVFASSLPATMTAQPSTARRRAQASPMPDDPPVIRTTLSAKPSTDTSRFARRQAYYRDAVRPRGDSCSRMRKAAASALSAQVST